MALALLAHEWVSKRQGTLHALVVDHGLRPESVEEALTTRRRLDLLGITATGLTLALPRGPALAERARIMRYAALSAACRSTGSLHLLVGHHALDQIETVMMRALRDSLTHGLAAMPALAETSGHSSAAAIFDVPSLDVADAIERPRYRMGGRSFEPRPKNAASKASASCRPAPFGRKHIQTERRPRRAVGDLRAGGGRGRRGTGRPGHRPTGGFRAVVARPDQRPGPCCPHPNDLGCCLWPRSAHKYPISPPGHGQRP